MVEKVLKTAAWMALTMAGPKDVMMAGPMVDETAS